MRITRTAFSLWAHSHAWRIWSTRYSAFATSKLAVSDGPPAEVLKDAAVIKAYLGAKFGKRHEVEFHQQQEKYQQELKSDRGTNE